MARLTNVPLCFILGPDHHGAGLLSWRMNQHPDVLSLGTCNPLRGQREVCSCGQPVSACPFWSGVSHSVGLQVDDPFDTYFPRSPYIFANETLNTWMGGALSVAAGQVSQKAWKIVYEPAARFSRVHDDFYEFCRDHSPHRLFVDAERSNLKFMTLTSMGFPVRHAVHLIRDPRAYVAAVHTHNPRLPVEKTAVQWAAAHTRIKKMRQIFTQVRFHPVRYEDLLTKPLDSLKQLFKQVGVKEIWPEELRVEPAKNHLTGLNAADMEEKLTASAENWRETLHPEDQERVVKAVGPLFTEFGFKA